MESFSVNRETALDLCTKDSWGGVGLIGGLRGSIWTLINTGHNRTVLTGVQVTSSLSALFFYVPLCSSLYLYGIKRKTRRSYRILSNLLPANYKKGINRQKPIALKLRDVQPPHVLKLKNTAAEVAGLLWAWTLAASLSFPAPAGSSKAPT